ncbi:MAG: hypothetical protein EOO61_12725 [Hymenobacter sp.]|nr:MAG: hypothetical protein EOO61_12725 [Hymenobacter sp.]
MRQVSESKSLFDYFRTNGKTLMLFVALFSCVLFLIIIFLDMANAATSDKYYFSKYLKNISNSSLLIVPVTIIISGSLITILLRYLNSSAPVYNYEDRIRAIELDDKIDDLERRLPATEG